MTSEFLCSLAQIYNRTPEMQIGRTNIIFQFTFDIDHQYYKPVINSCVTFPFSFFALRKQMRRWTYMQLVQMIPYTSREEILI